MPQSALEPAGAAAERIATLFWAMTAGGALIWLAVVGLSIYAIWIAPGRHRPGLANALIVGGGLIFPTVVLGGLLAYGLAMLPGFLAPAPPDALRIAVTGEQFWWRVRYLGAAGPVELANELRLPAGEPVELLLDSRDVIHSFWIPSLGGKADMIPGRKTRLLLEPTRPGRFRGVCAEYCGSSHAHMAFPVEVMEKSAFEGWLAQQALLARAPTEPMAARGRALFSATGCGACHTVRGTDADGTVGPDLTHVASRGTLGAALVDNTPDDLGRWLAHTDELKPGVLMPAFGMLPAVELAALAAYLGALE